MYSSEQKVIFTMSEFCHSLGRSKIRFSGGHTYMFMRNEFNFKADKFSFLRKNEVSELGSHPCVYCTQNQIFYVGEPVPVYFKEKNMIFEGRGCVL